MVIFLYNLYIFLFGVDTVTLFCFGSQHYCYKEGVVYFLQHIATQPTF